MRDLHPRLGDSRRGEVRGRWTWVAVTALAGAGVAAVWHFFVTTPATKTAAPTAAAASEAPLEQPVAVADAPDARRTVEGRRLGDTLATAHYSIRVERAKECKVAYYFRPQRDNIKLSVHVVIEGTGDGDVPVSPFYSKLRDETQRTHSTTFGGCEPALKAVRVAKGEKASGWITFEIPASARGLEFEYDPMLVGSPKEVVRFALDR